MDKLLQYKLFTVIYVCIKDDYNSICLFTDPTH